MIFFMILFDYVAHVCGVCGWGMGVGCCANARVCVHGPGQRSASGILPLNAVHLDFPAVSVFVPFPIALIQPSDKSDLKEKVQSITAGSSRQRELEAVSHVYILNPYMVPPAVGVSSHLN